MKKYVRRHEKPMTTAVGSNMPLMDRPMRENENAAIMARQVLDK
jgi:hypothetical protein